MFYTLKRHERKENDKKKPSSRNGFIKCKIFPFILFVTLRLPQLPSQYVRVSSIIIMKVVLKIPLVSINIILDDIKGNPGRLLVVA